MIQVLSLDEVKTKVECALNRLYERDQLLLDIDVNERSITHKLAEYLQLEFPKLSVDCEYNRDHDVTKQLQLPKNDVPEDDTHARTVFPDIIVHKRNTRDNLLVIEVKKDTNTNTDEHDFDRKKLQAFRTELGYKHALFLKLSMSRGPAVPYELEWVRPARG